MRLAAVLLALGAAPAQAAFTGDDPGSSSAVFLKLGPGGRALGMGEAHSVLVADPSAAYWNPAALARLKRPRSALFAHTDYLAGSFYDYGAAAVRAGRFTWAASFQYQSAGSIPKRDTVGTDLGTFTPSDFAGGPSLAWEGGDAAIGRPYTLGVSAKYIHSVIDTTARGYAFDAGILFPIDADNRWGAAAVVQNAGPGLKFKGDAAPLPLTLRFGTAIRLSPTWMVEADLIMARDAKPALALGTERRLSDRFGGSPALRFGFNTRAPSDIKGVAGISTGLGMAFERFDVDYAFTPFGHLGLTHQLSVAFGF